MVRYVTEFKHNNKKEVRSFGGLHVIICGDFWQLPPPDGGFLGDIPVEYIQNGRMFNPAP